MYFLAVVLEATKKATTILLCHDQFVLNEWFDQWKVIGTGALGADTITSALRRGGNAPRGSELVNLPPFGWARSLVGKLVLIQIADNYPRPGSELLHVIDLDDKYGVH